MKLLDKINSRCSVWSIGGFFVYLRYSRTAVLALALINQILSAAGKPVLPIESAQLEQLISTGFTTVSALVNWWFNNSFTKEAIQADAEFERLRKSVKRHKRPLNRKKLRHLLRKGGGARGGAGSFYFNEYML